MTLDRPMKRHILTPLFMTNTGLDLPPRINPGRAYGHTEENGEMVNAENDTLSAFEVPGELYSRVLDLKKWCDAMFDCPLVCPRTRWCPLVVSPVWFLGQGRDEPAWCGHRRS
jgi:CubicO group peptidase (beta-lactamase class C family)